MAHAIFVTGGVISSLGKGIAVASLGRMLKNRGFNVALLKCDPYLNVDPGTMSPYQHGEVFVTVDGRETDLDLGHYERFADIQLTSRSNMTAGQIYRELISAERGGKYLGVTIQTIPHVTNAIKNHILQLIHETEADVLVVEVGGTVGDIESQPFLEAIRQLRGDSAIEGTCYVHLTLLPTIANGEIKTKPTQHSVQILRGLGIQPDLILCRSDREDMPESAKRKVSMHCNVPIEGVVHLPTVDNVYTIPLVMEDMGVGEFVCKTLGVEERPANFDDWRRVVEVDTEDFDELTIAIVGKYVEQPDTYISVVESLKHATQANERKLNIRWVDATTINQENVERILKGVNGIVVPGGFDRRGIDGMITTAEFARENRVPYLGLCLGMQVMVIEFARNVLGITDADSVECDPATTEPIIDIMPEQAKIDNLGGTMRLGLWECKLVEGSIAHRAYDQDQIRERHRHRYEVNPQYVDRLKQGGMRISGVSVPGDLVEICELTHHLFMLGCQYHPEFGSRPDRPHPLFLEFIKSAKQVLLSGKQSKLFSHSHPSRMSTTSA